MELTFPQPVGDAQKPTVVLSVHFWASQGNAALWIIDVGYLSPISWSLSSLWRVEQVVQIQGEIKKTGK